MTHLRKAVAFITATGLMVRSRVARPARPPRVDYKRVFVGGCPRSGTTWVWDMFGQHPRVVGTNHEAHAWDDVFRMFQTSGHGLLVWAKFLYRDGENRRRGAGSRFHRWIDRRALQRVASWAMGAPGTAEEVAEELIDAIFDHHVAAHADHNRPVLVEKTPANIFYADRILRRHPEARFLEVRRDGRDVVVSLAKIAHRGRFPKERPRQIAAWVEAVQAGMVLQERSDPTGRVSFVRYEDLKADPVEGVRRLWGFAGLEHERKDAEAAARATSFEALRQTTTTGDGLFRRKGAVGDWVGTLDEADLALFRERAGATLIAAGYSF